MMMNDIFPNLLNYHLLSKETAVIMEIFCQNFGDEVFERNDGGKLK